MNIILIFMFIFSSKHFYLLWEIHICVMFEHINAIQDICAPVDFSSSYILLIAIVFLKMFKVRKHFTHLDKSIMRYIGRKVWDVRHFKVTGPLVLASITGSSERVSTGLRYFISLMSRCFMHKKWNTES